MHSAIDYFNLFTKKKTLLSIRDLDKKDYSYYLRLPSWQTCKWTQRAVTEAMSTTIQLYACNVIFDSAMIAIACKSITLRRPVTWWRHRAQAWRLAVIRVWRDYSAVREARCYVYLMSIWVSYSMVNTKIMVESLRFAGCSINQQFSHN